MQQVKVRSSSLDASPLLIPRPEISEIGCRDKKEWRQMPTAMRRKGGEVGFGDGGGGGGGAAVTMMAMEMAMLAALFHQLSQDPVSTRLKLWIGLEIWRGVLVKMANAATSWACTVPREAQGR